MEQRGLFDEQQENLARVRQKIEGLILDFCRGRLVLGRPDFRMEELHKFVCAADARIAPDSPGRILRLLHQAGRVGYVIVNRAQSHYRLTGKGQ